MSTCLFCQIISGEIPALRVAETERAIAFMDIFPATPGHTLVVPRAHAVDACMALAARVGRAAEAELGAEGVVFQTLARPAAGQTVFHVHIHVIPRRANDGFAFPWPSVAGDLADIEMLAERLRAGVENA
jgi:histidine triad (HIT) family protein